MDIVRIRSDPYLLFGSVRLPDLPLLVKYSPTCLIFNYPFFLNFFIFFDSDLTLANSVCQAGVGRHIPRHGADRQHRVRVARYKLQLWVNIALSWFVVTVVGLALAVTHLILGATHADQIQFWQEQFLGHLTLLFFVHEAHVVLLRRHGRVSLAPQAGGALVPSG